MKDLSYYLNQKYPLKITFDEYSKYFLAEYPDLKGCISCGKTEEEAVSMAEDAKKSWLQTAMEEGIEIPMPKSVIKSITPSIMSKKTEDAIQNLSKEDYDYRKTHKALCELTDKMLKNTKEMDKGQVGIAEVIKKLERIQEEHPGSIVDVYEGEEIGIVLWDKGKEVGFIRTRKN